MVYFHLLCPLPPPPQKKYAAVNNNKQQQLFTVMTICCDSLVTTVSIHFTSVVYLQLGVAVLCCKLCNHLIVPCMKKTCNLSGHPEVRKNPMKPYIRTGLHISGRSKWLAISAEQKQRAPGAASSIFKLQQLTNKSVSYIAIVARVKRKQRWPFQASGLVLAEIFRVLQWGVMLFNQSVNATGIRTIDLTGLHEYRQTIFSAN